jgi:hypothetical protein
VTERSAEHRDFFISRAGENAAVAIQIAEILRGAGYSTFIQDRDFGNADFMARMADGFAMVDRGARVIALLSHHYQKKPHCMKEAHYPLTDDPSNKRGAAYCPARQRLHAGRAPQGHPVPRGETTVTATGADGWLCGWLIGADGHGWVPIGAGAHSGSYPREGR